LTSPPRRGCADLCDTIGAASAGSDPVAGRAKIAAAGTSLARVGSRLPDGAAPVDATTAVGRPAAGIATGAG